MHAYDNAFSLSVDRLELQGAPARVNSLHGKNANGTVLIIEEGER